jgi:hypothetical protein
VLTYVDTEVYPLTDGFAALKGMIGALKMAEQMMPGAPK